MSSPNFKQAAETYFDAECEAQKIEGFVVGAEFVSRTQADLIEALRSSLTALGSKHPSYQHGKKVLLSLGVAL